MKNKAIELKIKDWDWKAQVIWEDKTPIPLILNQIESWYFKTEEFNLDIASLDLSLYGNFWAEDLFDFIVHCSLINNANLEYPIILNRKWAIIDWRHRLAKAIILWKETIKAIKILDANIV